MLNDYMIWPIVSYIPVQKHGYISLKVSAGYDKRL